MQCYVIPLQVRSNFRAAITIPQRSWERFRDVISEFASKEHSGPSAGGSGGDGGGGSLGNVTTSANREVTIISSSTADGI